MNHFSRRRWIKYIESMMPMLIQFHDGHRGHAGQEWPMRLAALPRDRRRPAGHKNIVVIMTWLVGEGAMEWRAGRYGDFTSRRRKHLNILAICAHY